MNPADWTNIKMHKSTVTCAAGIILLSIAAQGTLYGLAPHYLGVPTQILLAAVGYVALYEGACLKPPTPPTANQ